MQPMQVGAHLAISSFFCIAAGDLRSTTFGYEGKKGFERKEWEISTAGEEVEQPTALPQEG